MARALGGTSAGWLALLALSVPAPGSAVVASRAAREVGGGCEVLHPRVTAATFTVEQRIAQARKGHAEVRRLSNAAMPEAATMVLIMLSSGHYSFTNLSYVATRGAGGSWTVDRVGRTTHVSPDTPALVEPVTRRVLPKRAGRMLDGLLADRCLYAQPFTTADNDPGPVGSWGTGLAVV